MPRKISYKKKDIEDAAFEFVRKNGHEALNARAVAAQLGCSTQPIFSNFHNMQELMDCVLKRSLEVYNKTVANEMADPNHPSPYKAVGMGYIKFAMNEKNLFKLLFMRDRTTEEKTHVEDSTFVEVLPHIMRALDTTEEMAAKFHLSMWVVVHGIASMIATSYYDWNLEMASQMISEAFVGIRNTIIGENNGKHN